MEWRENRMKWIECGVEVREFCLDAWIGRVMFCISMQFEFHDSCSPFSLPIQRSGIILGFHLHHRRHRHCRSRRRCLCLRMGIGYTLIRDFLWPDWSARDRTIDPHLQNHPHSHHHQHSDRHANFQLKLVLQEVYPE